MLARLHLHGSDRRGNLVLVEDVHGRRDVGIHVSYDKLGPQRRKLMLLKVVDDVSAAPVWVGTERRKGNAVIPALDVVLQVLVYSLAMLLGVSEVIASPAIYRSKGN